MIHNHQQKPFGGLAVCLAALAVMLASCAPAFAQPHILSIGQPYTFEGRPQVNVIGVWLRNHSVEIECSLSHQFDNTFKGFRAGCNPNAENTPIIVAFARDLLITCDTPPVIVVDPPQMYFRAKNTPCGPGEAALAFFENPFGL